MLVVELGNVSCVVSAVVPGNEMRILRGVIRIVVVPAVRAVATLLSICHWRPTL